MDNTTRKQYLVGLEAQLAERKHELTDAEDAMARHEPGALPCALCMAEVLRLRRLVEELEEPLAHLRHAVKHADGG